MGRKPSIPPEVAERCLAEYLAGHSLRKIAAKHGVSPDALMRLAAKGKWESKRQASAAEARQEIAEKLPAAIAERVAGMVTDALAERLVVHRRITARLLELAEAAADPTAVQVVLTGGGEAGPSRTILPKLNTTRDLKALADALRALVATDGELYGAITARDAAALEIQRDRLEIDRQKAGADDDGEDKLPAIIPAHSEDWQSLVGGDSQQGMDAE